MRNIANETSPNPLQKGDFLLVILNGVKNLKSASVCILVHALEILRFALDDKKPCHSERSLRSDESRVHSAAFLVHAFEILRFAQDDKTRDRGEKKRKEIQFPHFSSSN